MPGWLVRSDRVRAFELASDFLRLSARQAPEEFFQQACDFLRRLWEADGVTLWRLDAGGRALQPLAASAPEWECFGDLTLEAFPELDRALPEGEPAWLAEGEAGRRLLPPPLNEAARLLVLPVMAGGGAAGAPPAGERRGAACWCFRLWPAGAPRAASSAASPSPPPSPPRRSCDSGRWWRRRSGDGSSRWGCGRFRSSSSASGKPGGGPRARCGAPGPPP